MKLGWELFIEVKVANLWGQYSSVPEAGLCEKNACQHYEKLKEYHNIQVSCPYYIYKYLIDTFKYKTCYPNKKYTWCG